MPFGDNTNNELDQLLAPYQAAAQKLNAPYATMGQGGWLGANHPGIAHVLDNAFLTAAMTPGPQGPEGVGGGISRTFQGLLGGEQYNRTRALQAAMLPYQMLQPRLQAEDTLAQINDRNSEGPYRREMGARAMAQADFYNKRITSMDNMKALTGGKRTDDNGDAWHEVFDPKSGHVRLQNSANEQFADELSPDKQPKFTNEASHARAAQVNEDYTQSGILRRLHAGDPTAKGDYDRFMELQTGLAGGRKTAETGVTTPIEQDKSLVSAEQHDMEQRVRPLTPNEFKGQHEFDPDYMLHGQASYDKYLAQAQMKQTQAQNNFAQYRTSHRPGETFAQWDSRMTATATGKVQPDAPAASGSGSNWSPK